MGIALTPSLLDTNILVYANNLDAPLHLPCRQLLEQAIAGHFPAYVAHQNLLELYAVVTDKRRVGNPLNPQSANELISFYLTAKNITIIYPATTTFSLLSKLISAHSPRSHGIFDLMLVAMMKEYGITTIHTANIKHFSDFTGITPISP